MNALRYAPYHAKLNRRRGEVVKTLEYLRQEQRIVAENREWIDDRAFESRRALLDGLAQWYIDEAARIDAALMRIRDGGYGKCLDCGKPIAPPRLEAAPEVPFCADCQPPEDRSSKARSH